MGKKYICEVKKDDKNSELELVNAKHFNSLGKDGGIKFSTHHEMNKYFNHYCVSEDQLQNDSSSLFMFLFFLLLLIFIVTIICQMFMRSSSGSINGKTTFGRFSF